MAQWFRRVAVSQATMPRHGFDLCRALKHSAFPVILRGTEPVSALKRVLLYCCTLYNFSFLGFVSGNLALTGF